MWEIFKEGRKKSAVLHAHFHQICEEDWTLELVFYTIFQIILDMNHLVMSSNPRVREHIWSWFNKAACLKSVSDGWYVTIEYHPFVSNKRHQLPNIMSSPILINNSPIECQDANIDTPCVPNKTSGLLMCFEMSSISQLPE